MKDEDKVRAAVEREEARIAARVQGEEHIGTGARRWDEPRLLSVVIETLLGLSGVLADEAAVRLLDLTDYGTARRAVSMAARREPPVVDDEGLFQIAEALVHADRLVDLRRRARDGDADAAALLVAHRRAMRLAGVRPEDA